MSTIGKNIKKIRTVKKLSQAQFAQLFNLARPSVGAYEEGRSEPKIENVIQIARYFGISIDSLLTKELTINDLYKFDLRAREITQLKSAATSATVKGNKTSFVRSDQQFEYIVQLHNKDFLSGLTFITTPENILTNTRAFELAQGNFPSIHGVFYAGDIVFGRKVEHMNQVEWDSEKFYLLVSDEGLVIKAGDGQDKQNEDKDNSKILEVWGIEALWTRNIKVPSRVADRLANLEQLMEGFNKRMEKVEQGQGSTSNTSKKK